MNVLSPKQITILVKLFKSCKIVRMKVENPVCKQISCPDCGPTIYLTFKIVGDFVSQCNQSVKKIKEIYTVPNMS